MIILDTNIVSEFMTSPPASAVLNWLNDQDASSLYLTSITIAEINYGLGIMPNGKRKKLLEERFKLFVDSAFKQRILNFDENAAVIYGDLMAEKRNIGQPMSCFDGQIAAIARLHSCAIATRNIKDFTDCQLDLINPFDFNTH
ncbi:type II toxin-antitoxin system VapC family toxin [Colwellia echini]|uniref:Type II toxin-antitoxin system VapC family toxin n=1 Tax=Colwellia echini TaxID=1982103 RepID=A0ABY3MW37_9GAMM|nr:type II toxin-antitoxin system VapC family toxin [Colwellia echini]TYK65319.1 type II toxin-antitoxin system VapC family toxin [Colwellia echini]